MSNLILESIYSKSNSVVPSYLDVIFKTNKGMFKIGYGLFEQYLENDLSTYHKDELVKLKSEYLTLIIDDARVEYDNSMFFLISNNFILVLNYEPSTYSETSDQMFSIIKDIHGTNKRDLIDFNKMDKVDLPN